MNINLFHNSNQIKCLLILFLILLFAQEASASNISINANKVLVLEGVPTFPTKINEMCSVYSTQNPPTAGYLSCADYITNFSNVTIGSYFHGQVLTGAYGWDTQYPLYEAEQMYTIVGQAYYYSSIGDRRNATYYGFAKMRPDEPMEDTNCGNPSDALCMDWLLDNYSRWRTAELQAHQTHLAIGTAYQYKAGGHNMSEGSDIFEADIYTLKTNCGSLTAMYNRYKSGDPTSCTPFFGWVDDFLYMKDRDLRTQILQDSGYDSVDDMPEPVWSLYTVMAQNYLEGGANSKRYHATTPQKLRAEGYWAAIVGMKGIGFYSNLHSSWDLPYTMGGNATVRQWVNNFAGEIADPDMQDALVSPTVNYSWNYYKTWDNKVTFSTNPTKSVYYSELAYTLTYRLNYNSTSGKYYLFVLNKRNTSISPTITISGMSGTKYATTMGLAATGSAAQGQSHTMTDGVFSDTFDAYGAHIYEITGEANPTPAITSWGNTKTGDDILSIALNTSESVTFNATANQSITTWNWYVDGESAGNNTAYFQTSFTSGGIINVSVSGTNENGTTDAAIWSVNVNPTTSYDSIVGVGGVAFSSINSNFSHTTVNKGDGKVTVGLFADNCNDGTSDWSAGICSNGKLTTSGTSYTTMRQSISEYTNVTLFFVSNESTLTPWTADIRSHSGRVEAQRYQVYPNVTHENLNYMTTGYASTTLNFTQIRRILGTDQYNIFDLSGSVLRYYSALGSYL